MNFLRTTSYSFRRYLHSETRRKLVLGIETSCDDTAMAVVDETGQVLGEGHNSQLETHVSFGGILPRIAQILHTENIEKVYIETMQSSGVDMDQIDAIAVTNRPGLGLSLQVGLGLAKRLSHEHLKPVIPVHHMEAHALVVRSCQQVEFPFLVLLVSGGHCQIALAQDVRTFKLLGEATDSAPGQAIDKIARRLKIRHIAGLENVSGGAAIESLAKTGDPLSYYNQITMPMLKSHNCNFSFSGLRSQFEKIINTMESQHHITGSSRIPRLEDFCASVQYAFFYHIAKRLFRAMHFCRRSELDFGDRLVVSGGVACSSYLRAMLQQCCDEEQVQLFVPPRKLCSDNGVMIAWNGMERLLTDEQLLSPEQAQQIDYYPTCPLGTSLRSEVAREAIPTKKFKFDQERLRRDSGQSPLNTSGLDVSENQISE